MTDEGRVWLFFVGITLVVILSLVLLQTDGVSSLAVFAMGVVALCPHVLLFRNAWRQPEGSKIRKAFYRWGGDVRLS